MIINFGKEDIHEYKYNFPEGECIANVTVQKSETWEKTIRKTASLLKDSLGLFRKIENVFLWTKTEIYSSPSKLKQKKHIFLSILTSKKALKKEPFWLFYFCLFKLFSDCSF